MKKKAVKAFGRASGRKKQTADHGHVESKPHAALGKQEAHREFKNALEKPIKTITKFMTKRLKKAKKDGDAKKTYITRDDLQEQED